MTENIHVFLSFGIYGILRKHLQISVTKMHKIDNVDSKTDKKLCQNDFCSCQAASHCFTKQFCPFSAWTSLRSFRLHWCTYSETLLRGECTKTCYILRDQYATRSSQQTDGLSAAISILQVITGSFFQWGDQGETMLFQGGSIWIHHLSFYCTGTLGDS